MKDDVVIVIPAYNPSNILVEIINKLQEEKYTKIIVINDGSKDKQVFDKLKNKVIVLEHAVNQGKGCALKIGFSYCSNNLKDIIGVITVDADGQHEIDDINKLYSMFQKKTNCIILGSRNFKNRNIPLKSKFGNNVMSIIVKQKTKVKIKDTQTGLRAIPIKYINEIIKLKGKRFEYETNMLLHCISKKIDIIEVPIKTIYMKNNRTSNFRPLKDSIQICKTIIKR